MVGNVVGSRKNADPSNWISRHTKRSTACKPKKKLLWVTICLEELSRYWLSLARPTLKAFIEKVLNHGLSLELVVELLASPYCKAIHIETKLCWIMLFGFKSHCLPETLYREDTLRHCNKKAAESWFWCWYVKQASKRLEVWEIVLNHGLRWWQQKQTIVMPGGTWNEWKTMNHGLLTE